MDSNDFKGKVVLITGASSGIGRATSQLFAHHGAKLALFGRKENALALTKTLCIKEGLSDSDILCVKADLARETELRKGIDNVLSFFKTVDVLINNAGLLLNDNIETFDVTKYDDVMSVNTRAVVLMTHLLTPTLIASKGNIVNVSSIAGTNSFPGILSYCMSKAALQQFTKCVALDLAPKGVRVNSVTPGVIVTDIHLRGGMSEQDYAAFLERCRTTHALGRTGTSDEVAKTIFFLASPSASFITGAGVPVDGGRHAMCPI